MQWGEYKIREVILGRFRLDGGAMFGLIPKVIWEKIFSADGQNRIGLVARSLLIESGNDFKCLIDTGPGPAWSSQMAERIGLNSSALPNPAEILQSELSVSVDQISHVLCTHLHFDHAGGLINADGQRTFPNAVLWVGEEHYRHAKSPPQREEASFRPTDWQPYEKSSQINLIRGERAELKKGIFVEKSNGHSIGMLRVIINNKKGNELHFPADLIPTHAHLSLNASMGYDLQPLVIMEEKLRLLERLCTEQHKDSRIVFIHDEKVALGSAERRSRGDGRRIDFKLGPETLDKII